MLADTEATRLAGLLTLSSLPIFLGGFGEDTGFEVSPKMRLLLSFFSAVIAGLLLNTWITRSGVPGLDWVLTITFCSILFTITLSGGICHAMNLIDGLNGLSLGLTLMMAASLAMISVQVGDAAMATLILAFAGSVAGIFAFNFPLGKLFLGDAGAYTIGHMLTWIAILLLNRNPEIAPLALFLIFFWPIADMLFSIVRRVRNGKPIDEPDRMHFHQLVMRAIELTIIRRKSVTNPLAATMIWPLAAVPICLAVTFFNANILAAISWILCFLVFVWTYISGIRAARFLSRARKNNENLMQTIVREGLAKVRHAASRKTKSYPAE